MRGISDGNVQGYSFRPPKKYKPRKLAAWCRRNLHGIVRNSGSLDHSALPNILSSDVKGEYDAKGTEKCQIIGS